MRLEIEPGTSLPPPSDERRRRYENCARIDLPPDYVAMLATSNVGVPVRKFFAAGFGAASRRRDARSRGLAAGHLRVTPHKAVDIMRTLRDYVERLPKKLDKRHTLLMALVAAEGVRAERNRSAHSSTRFNDEDAVEEYPLRQ